MSRSTSSSSLTTLDRCASDMVANEDWAKKCPLIGGVAVEEGRRTVAGSDPPEEVVRIELVAVRRVALAALAALPARAEGQRDLVAGPDVGDVGADGLHHAGALVPEDGGGRAAETRPPGGRSRRCGRRRRRGCGPTHRRARGSSRRSSLTSSGVFLATATAADTTGIQAPLPSGILGIASTYRHQWSADKGVGQESGAPGARAGGPSQLWGRIAKYR